MSVFHQVEIKKIIRQTPDAVSIELNVPEALKADFGYKSGQYITFKVDVNGEKLNRSYSLCSSPYNGENPTIAVKEVKGGKVSTFLNKQIKEGDVLEAMPPMGNFLLDPNPEASNHYILFGGGSGITPLFAILKSVLQKEPKSKVTLFYANYNSNSVIFKSDLTQLAEGNSSFNLYHIFDKPVKSGGFLGFGKKSNEDLDFVEGQITEKMALKLLKNHTDLDFKSSQFYMCGPSGLMDSVSSTLNTLGIPKERVHREYFTEKSEDEKTAADVGKADASFDGKATVTVVYDGNESSFDMKDSQTLLDAALDANVDPPFACMVGACTTCRAKLVEGSVHMDDSDALTAGEIDAGYVLTCQAHPKSSVVKVNYDE